MPTGQKPVITQQFPRETIEVRRKLGSPAYEARKVDSKVHTKFVGDRLFINNELVRDPRPTPKPRDILNLSTNDQREVYKIPSCEGNTVTEKGNTFVATIAYVLSSDQARKAYKKLLLDPKNLAQHTT